MRSSEFALPVFILLVTAVVVVVVGKVCEDITSCPGMGYYSRCQNFCDTQFYTCKAALEKGVLTTCPFGLVFDPAPDRMVCVLFNNCTKVANDCLPAGFTCTEFSLDPRCPYCDRSFHLCDGVNDLQVETNCPVGEVFNPIPSRAGCIPEDECPCIDGYC